MKMKWTGDDEITIRGVTFKKGKAVTVEGALLAKVQNIPGFVQAKRDDKKANR